MCYYADNQPFFVDGNANLKIYYFEYKGFGPEIYLKGDSACKFQGRNDLELGFKKVWFKANMFGGPCKYLILLGVD